MLPNLQKIESLEQLNKKLEHGVSVGRLKCEHAAKREAACDQRELACELMLQGEEARLQTVVGQAKAAAEGERQELLRHVSSLERRVEELRREAEECRDAKERAEASLVLQIQRTSDEKLFEAFARLRDFVTTEHDKMEHANSSLTELMSVQEHNLTMMAEKDRELHEVRVHWDQTQRQLEEAQRSASALQAELEALKAKHTEEVLSVKEQHLLDKERGNSLQQELDLVVTENRCPAPLYPKP